MRTSRTRASAASAPSPRGTRIPAPPLPPQTTTPRRVSPAVRAAPRLASASPRGARRPASANASELECRDVLVIATEAVRRCTRVCLLFHEHVLLIDVLDHGEEAPEVDGS